MSRIISFICDPWIGKTRNLARHANAKSPFFSPDGQWVGFVGGPNTNQLKRVSINGGAPITISDLPGNVFGARWEAGETILYGYFGGVWKVSAAGGTPEPLIALDAANNEWAADPELLAEGDAILFRTGVGNSPAEFPVTGQIVAHRCHPATDESSSIEPSEPHPFPVATCCRARNRFARGAVRCRRLEITGGPVPLTDGIFPGPVHCGPRPHTCICLVLDNDCRGRHVGMGDRAGRVTPFSQPRASFHTPRLSPDGRRSP